jgi:hypothetical protein
VSADSPLIIKAGPVALAHIRRNGFHFSDVKVVVGASGGAKWLALNRIDRVLFPGLAAPREDPLFLLGSSIGAWRLSCLAQRDPIEAMDRFEAGYLSDLWTTKPDRAELERRLRIMMDGFIGAVGVKDILSHPFMRMSIMAVRSKGLMASDNLLLLVPMLLAVASANAVSRNLLGGFFERALFYNDRETPPFIRADDLPVRPIPLSAENYIDAVVATSAIPVITNGISHIPGAPTGSYRDGGFIDYHFDLPFLGDGDGKGDGRFEGLVLFPHYRERIIPGWFDKPFKGRVPNPAHLENMILIAPSDEFARSLPYGKIPDRGDFKKMDTRIRIDYWKQVLRESEALSDQLQNILEKGNMGEIAEPF